MHHPIHAPTGKAVGRAPRYHLPQLFLVFSLFSAFLVYTFGTQQVAANAGSTASDVTVGQQIAVGESTLTILQREGDSVQGTLQLAFAEGMQSIPLHGLKVNEVGEVEGTFVNAALTIGGYPLSNGSATIRRDSRGTQKITLSGPVVVVTTVRSQTVTGLIELYQNGVTQRSLLGTVQYDVAGLILEVDKQTEAESQPPAVPTTVAAPVAAEQSLTSTKGVAQAITLQATDPANAALTYRISSQPVSGTVGGTPPNVTYTPNSDFVGNDAFFFVANNGAVDSNPARISISVEDAPAVPGVPQATDAAITIQKNTAKELSLRAADLEGSDLSYTIVTAPQNGTLTGVTPDGFIQRYTPNADYVGTDSFTYKASNGTSESNVSTINLNVVAPVTPPTNSPPVAQDQEVAVTVNTEQAITLVATDADNDSLTYSIVGNPSNGQLSGTPPNVTYTPNTDYNGSDSFTFKASDGKADSNTATVTVNVAVSEQVMVSAAQPTIATATNNVQGVRATVVQQVPGVVNNPESAVVLAAIRGRLKPPTGYGNSNTTVNNVTVTRDSANPQTPPKITIGSSGANFDLPSINVGGFRLILSGGLEQGANGSQLIRAKGTLDIPNLGAPIGCSGIEINVMLEKTAGVVRIQLAPPAKAGNALSPTGPLTPEAIEALKLREAGISLNCQIPIGQSGFAIYSMSGSIALDSGSTTISVSAGIGTLGKFLGTPFVSADGSVTLVSDPFSLAIQSGLKLWKLQVASTDAKIWAKGFSAGFTVRVMLVIEAGANVTSWVDARGFHFTGSGFAELSIPKKVIGPLPPKKVKLARAEIKVGEFQGGVWGIYAQAKVKILVAKFKVNVFFDFKTKKLSFGRGWNKKKLLTPSQVAAAYEKWQTIVRNNVQAASTATVDGIQFGSVEQPFPLTMTFPITQAGDYIVTFGRQGVNPSLTLITPGGTVITSDTLPAEGIDYIEDKVLDAEDEGAEFARTVSYLLNDPAQGEWKAVLNSEPSPDSDYSFDYYAIEPDPAFQSANLAVVSSAANGAATSATINWQLTAYADSLIAIYANPGPITDTVVIFDSDTTTTTVEMPNFTGIEVADGIEASEDGSPQSYELDPGELPSGTYHVWLEVDDGNNVPVRFYLPEPLVVDNSAQLGDTWQAGLTATPDYESIKLHWKLHPSPDVDSYIVYVGDREGGANPDDAIEEYVVGDDGDFELDNLDGGSDYYYSVAAVDDTEANASGELNLDTARKSLSEEIHTSTQVAEFTMTPSSQSISLAAGAVKTINLNLSSNVSPFPDDVYLYDDCGLNDGIPTNDNAIYLPLITKSGGNQSTASQVSSATVSADPVLCQEGDGFVIRFSPSSVLPTSGGVSVQVTIDASNVTKTGVYRVPIFGESNGSSQELDLTVTVTN